MTRGFRLIAITAVAALVLACSAAEAKPRKFSIIGAGETNGVPLPGGNAPHWSVGIGTGLGLYLGEGGVHTETAEFHADGTITGTFGSAVPFVFEGGGGDTLVCDYGRGPNGEYIGTFLLTPVGNPEDMMFTAFWIAEFVADPNASKGEFKGVTGSWTMYAVSEPFVLGSTDWIGYAWAGTGVLNFKK